MKCVYDSCFSKTNYAAEMKTSNNQYIERLLEISRHRNGMAYVYFYVIVHVCMCSCMYSIPACTYLYVIIYALTLYIIYGMIWSGKRR